MCKVCDVCDYSELLPLISEIYNSIHHIRNAVIDKLTSRIEQMDNSNKPLINAQILSVKFWMPEFGAFDRNLENVKFAFVVTYL